MTEQIVEVAFRPIADRIQTIDEDSMRMLRMRGFRVREIQVMINEKPVVAWECWLPKKGK